MSQGNPFEGIKWVWMNGRLVEFDKATVHVMAHALHYGSGLFEGIRCYDTRRGLGRVPAARAPQAARELVQGLPDGHPVHARGADPGGVRRHPLERARRVLHPADRLPRLRHGWASTRCNRPVDVAIARWPWGRYLGDDAIEEGRRRLRLDLAADAGSAARRRWPRRPPTTSIPSSSRWRRSPTATPRGSRSTPTATSRKGSGENVFLVMDGALYTPPVSSSILPGITRNAVITLAEEAGHRRCGARRYRAACSTPATKRSSPARRSRSRRSARSTAIAVGDGRPGPITRR